ncbi:MAG TPA: hypothetical protein VK600_00430 [Candidatus Saccharimonadales bacterium]|nr:hypothetical protein [Candidatus Saccharimonadales bacterium]
MSHDKDPQLVLTYAGDGNRYIPGIPARDLDEADIARSVYVRTVDSRPDKQAGLVPADKGFTAASKELTESLAASGLYRFVGGVDKAGGASRPTRSKAKKPAKAETPAESTPDQGVKPAEE